MQDSGYQSRHGELTPPTRHTSTITDVCNSGELPEVEIVSLLEEQIPRYRLRADTYTQFKGYDNEDWYIPYPALTTPDSDLDLSPHLAEETLNYFVLCGSRVNQMSKTYNDVDAVSRLLEEKEKDLELAARIGQSLLARNKGLEERISCLEGELNTANETVTQLRHDVTMKTELLQLYTADEESDAGTPVGIKNLNAELLQRRVEKLETENDSLRAEASQLAQDTSIYEGKEEKLVQDVVKELSDANLNVKILSEELARKVDDNLKHQEDVTSLLAQVVDLQAKAKRLNIENEELNNYRIAAKQTEMQLTAELIDFKEKYSEIADLLKETQEQLKRQKRRSEPVTRGNSIVNSLFSSPHPDSLASELESSLLGLGVPDTSVKEGTNKMKKIFETYRYASPKCDSYWPSVSCSTLSTNTQTAPMMSTLPLVLDGGSSTSGHYSMTSSLDSTVSSDVEDHYPHASKAGVPGYPGSPDLQVALSRINPQEIYARRERMDEAPKEYSSLGYCYSDVGVRTPPLLHRDLRTPDSIMSTGSSNRSNSWKMPEKLRLVKPMEGSQTLGHWARLATPHLGGIFEDRPGVQVKGEKSLAELDDVYSMSDVEEDDDPSINLVKRFQKTTGIYTFTNSTVMHPEENTMLTSSYGGAQMSSYPYSLYEEPRPPSRPLSRRNSCSTFSTNWGLAKMLNERGMSGSCTPSVANTPSIRSSPPGTPCNSPDGSSPSTHSPESSSREPFFSAFKLPGILSVTRTVSRGADLIRRTLYGSFSSDVIQEEEEDGQQEQELQQQQLPQPPLNVKLMERLQKIGLDNIVSAPSLTPPPVPGGVYTRRRLPSPMTQLTSLKTLGARQRAKAIKQPGELGVPAKPGSGAIDKMVNINKILKQRPELGTVGPSKQGSIHTFKGGRKGGLL